MIVNTNSDTDLHKIRTNTPLLIAQADITTIGLVTFHYITKQKVLSLCLFPYD